MEYSNNYLIKALEAYPYELEEAVESLNYALSYEPNNPTALGLYGRLCAEVYGDLKTAIEYYEAALAENVHLISIYPFYLIALINYEEYEKADRFIDFALSVKGSDKGGLYANRIMIYECLQKYSKALKVIKLAEKYAYNDQFMNYLDEFRKRIKKKMPETKKKSKKKTRGAK